MGYQRNGERNGEVNGQFMMPAWQAKVLGAILLAILLGAGGMVLSLNDRVNKLEGSADIPILERLNTVEASTRYNQLNWQENRERLRVLESKFFPQWHRPQE